MGQRAIPSRISRHSYHPGEQTVKNKNLDYRVIGINQGGDGRIEFGFGDMMLVDPGDLPPVKGLEGLGGLGRPEITAIAERRRHIARSCCVQASLLPGEAG